MLNQWNGRCWCWNIQLREFFWSTIGKPRRGALCRPYQSSIVNDTVVLPKKTKYGDVAWCSTHKFEEQEKSEGIKLEEEEEDQNTMWEITITEFVEQIGRN